MHRSTIALSVAACAVLFAGCGHGDGRRQLVVYSAHGKDILLHFEQDFEKAHPDVDVVTVYLSPPTLLERVRTERTNPQAGVWWGADSATLDVAAKEGLLLPYAPTYATPDLPHQAENLWTGCFQLPAVLGYHPDRVRAADLPKTIADLADPRFKNQIILREPSQSGVLRTFFASLIARSIKETGSEEAGFQLISGIHRNVRKYIASPELMFEELEHGPPSITVWNLTDLVFQRQQEGYHFAAAPFAEPVPVIVDGIALVKGPGDTPDARAFYEFVNSPEALAYLAHDHARMPLRAGFDRAQLLPEIRAVPVTPMPVDRDLIATHMKDWMARLERETHGGATK